MKTSRRMQVVLALAVIAALLVQWAVFADQIGVDNDIATNQPDKTVNLAANPGQDVSTSAQLYIQWNGSKHLSVGDVVVYQLDASSSALPVGITVGDASITIPSPWQDGKYGLGTSAISFKAPSTPGIYAYDVRYKFKSGPVCASASGANDCLTEQGNVQFFINLTVNGPTCSPPSVTSQPQNQSVTYGQDAYFSVGTGGSPSPTINWEVSTDDGASWGPTGMSGANLTIANPAVATSGSQYRAVLTNSCNPGTATSSAATLTVGKATPTINTWPTASAITYGDALSASTLSGGSASVLGAFAFDAPTTTPDASDYSAVVTFTPQDVANYNTVSGSVSVHVNKALLTVTAASPTIAYGDAEPSFAPSYNGFKFSDTAAVLDTAPTCGVSGAHTDAGSYTVTCSGGVDNNYDFTYVPGTLTINKAPLTVTADNQTKILNASNPALTYKITGFVLNEDSSVIDTLPTCATTALTNSLVGSYPITCSGGQDNNYNFTYVAGTLTVIYRFDGFLQPINDTAHSASCGTVCPLSVFKSGSTVPVKFQLKDYNGVPQQAATAVWTTPTKGVAIDTPVDEAVYNDASTSGSSYRWDSTAQQYIYNWSTKGFTAGFKYRLYAVIKDSQNQVIQTLYVDVGLK